MTRGEHRRHHRELRRHPDFGLCFIGRCGGRNGHDFRRRRAGRASLRRSRRGFRPAAQRVSRAGATLRTAPEKMRTFDIGAPEAFAYFRRVVTSEQVVLARSRSCRPPQPGFRCSGSRSLWRVTGSARSSAGCPRDFGWREEACSGYGSVALQALRHGSNPLRDEGAELGAPAGDRGCSPLATDRGIECSGECRDLWRLDRAVEQAEAKPGRASSFDHGQLLRVEGGLQDGHSNPWPETDARPSFEPAALQTFLRSAHRCATESRSGRHGRQKWTPPSST